MPPIPKIQKILTEKIRDADFPLRLVSDVRRGRTLRDEIGTSGITTPLLLHAVSGGPPFAVLRGARRLAIARALGLTHVPAIVRTIDNAADALFYALDHEHSAPLTLAERGRAYQRLQALGIGRDAMIARLGITAPLISRAVSAVNDPVLLEAMESGMVADGYIMELVSVAHAARPALIAKLKTKHVDKGAIRGLLRAAPRHRPSA